jgi:isopentenyl diphosphate isomerase/L-lactate dehydrogenase-like FMN-dependent dehydrogenase
MPEQFATIAQILSAARANLGHDEWTYISGGSETETTLRNNRAALDAITFRPRVLRDVSSIDVTSSLLGHALRIPVVLAPLANLQLVLPEAALAAARAAAEFGVITHASFLTEPSLEEVAAATTAPKFFQMYIRGDAAWANALIDRAKQAGYAALTLTVDSPYFLQPDRHLETGWRPPGVTKFKPELRLWQAKLTWEWMAQMKAHAGIPFIVKGVQTGEDAELAVAHGVAAVYVSNHGGRQLDHVDGTIDILPEVVAAVKGRAPIIVDGGFTRGTDIVKAIALGANAVALGRLQAYALAAGGERGLVRTREILEAEIRTVLGLLGIKSLAELEPSHVRKAAR